jgi:hypothetical protein
MMIPNNTIESQDAQSSGPNGGLKTYDFDREREYLEVLRSKIQEKDDQEERKARFVEKVRQDVKDRLEALTR